MKIVHISDVHIRNLKYHLDYRNVFENLYKQLEIIKPDIVVNTGDTAHTKTQISPEFVEMTSEHIRRVSSIAEYHILLGNHDLNLMNLDRQDAISPIVDSINSKNVVLHKNSGMYKIADGWNFWIFSLADQKNYPSPADWKNVDGVNMGLFHGSISKCVTDSDWKMTHTEHDISIFNGLDYAFLGDIHKQQFFNDRRIAYAGSLVQQNFGEDVNKGFLLWDIKDKNDFSVKSYFLDGSRKFYTIRLNEDLSVPDMEIGDNSRIRISPPKELTLAQKKEIEKIVKKKYKPYDVITLSAANVLSRRTKLSRGKIEHGNIRQLPAQENLLRDFLKEKEADSELVSAVIDLNKKYQISFEQDDETTRDIDWKINKIAWNNLFNYGEDNIIDFSHLNGLTGIFAPNATGKSSMVDTILETCFDNTTRGITKNIHLINEKKEIATMIADITANEQNYIIERTIEKLKYGQRKFGESKEWGKTTCNFYAVDDVGSLEPLVGTLRPETERNIRQRIGSYEDLLLTSLSAQWNPLDIISCKETKRKEILYRFLDLDIFEKKCIMAKDESKAFYKQLSDMEDSGIEDHIKSYKASISGIKVKIKEKNTLLESYQLKLNEINDSILHETSQKIKIELGVNDAGSARLKINEIDKSLESLNKEALDKKEKLDTINDQLDKLNKLKERFDLELYTKNNDRFNDIINELVAIKSKLAMLDTTLGSKKKSIKLLNEVPCGDSYPQCKFLIDAFESKDSITLLNKERDNLLENEISLNGELEDLRQYADKLSAYNKFVSEELTLISNRDNIMLQIENILLKISSNEKSREENIGIITKSEKVIDDVKRNAEIELVIKELDTSKIAVNNEIKKIRTEISELNIELGSEQGIFEKIRCQLDDLNELRKTCNAYEMYINAMGKDGIAYRILTQKLPIINDEINKLLSDSVDFGVTIEHDAEEQSIRLYLQYEEDRSRLIELGSGAEKMLASIAIRVALISISNMPKSNMFIIDEGFGKLDVEKLESMNKMFDYLKSVFDHVIIISHIDSMKDIVDNMIEITTDEEGFAHIDIS